MQQARPGLELRELTPHVRSSQLGLELGRQAPVGFERCAVAPAPGQLEHGANTKGVGAQPLAPTVLADGTKEFDLTAAITDWEVSPGNVVQAWTYNGTVPGPTIKVQPGDHVRIVLDNKLPQSTAIHFHGVQVPNAMDGVPFVTQPPVKPGERFTYDFVAQGPAVGMYHSHHHAEHQVPDGLMGALIIGDQPLPADVTVSQEVPMVLNDAGVIGLTLNGKSYTVTLHSGLAMANALSSGWNARSTWRFSLKRRRRSSTWKTFSVKIDG